MWFFLSYAHADNRRREARLVETFFEDLRDEVASKTDDPPDARIGYLDSFDLQAGDAWPEALAQAACTSRSFVAIMTAGYFTRPYCGREWQLFEQRCKAIVTDDGDLPPLILPLLWDRPEEGEFPDFAQRLQFTVSMEGVRTQERELLEDYAKHGLMHVIKRRESSHRNAYETFLEKLARRIVQVATGYPLPSMHHSAQPSLDQVPNRFALPSVVPTGQPASTASTRANFVVVAAKDAEMQTIRTGNAACYGALHSNDWVPFSPSSQESVALLAQREASSRDLVAEWVPVDEDLVRRLRDAETQNSLAVVIIDPWTVEVDKYRRLLEEFDQHLFGNCAVVVAWNLDDPQTSSHAANLRDKLHAALERRFRFRSLLHDDVCSAQELATELGSTLQELEEYLSPQREPQRETGASRFETLPAIDTTSLSRA